MSEQENTATPAPEVKKPEETATPTEAPKAPEGEAPKAPEAPKEPTVAEVLAPTKEPKKETETVPRARLNKEIDRNKEMAAEIERLKLGASGGDMSKGEIARSVKDLAEKHGLDTGFLGELTEVLRAEFEAGVDKRLKPITEREKAEKIDRAFQQGFKTAMENMPEYEGVVNPAIIKSLSLDPANASKTFRQLIEETYSNALSGKRTIETTTPRGGNTSGELDYERAKKDPAYFKEVMADPAMKKKYNERMVEEGI